MNALNKINNIIDFDFHGAIGIRLVNPSSSDVKVITNKFDIVQKEIESEPDIIITYKKKLQSDNLTFIGLHTAAYSADNFYILSNGKEDVKVIIPFENIGKKQLHIVCESGSPDIPALNHIVNLIFLSKGYLPLHSTAFKYNNEGILVMGWSKGGKSESLFSFMKNNADFVSDEVSIISKDGKEILGLKVPVCIWKWQFKEIPEFMPKLGMQKKILFAIVQILHAFQKVSNRSSLRKVLFLLNGKLNVKVLPSKIFKSNKIIDKAKLDKIILSMSHDSEEIIIKKIPAREIIDRMISSQRYELDYFMQLYNIFKYAFPEKKNDFLENIENLQQRIMNKLLGEKQSFIVKHPYPVSFNKLFESMKTIFDEHRVKIENPDESKVTIQS